MMCLITFLASIVYVVFNGYSPEKVTVILLVCIYKILDSVADTFEGEFQKEERIDMSGVLQDILQYTGSCCNSNYNKKSDILSDMYECSCIAYNSVS